MSTPPPLLLPPAGSTALPRQCIPSSSPAAFLSLVAAHLPAGPDARTTVFVCATRAAFLHDLQHRASSSSSTTISTSKPSTPNTPNASEVSASNSPSLSSADAITFATTATDIFASTPTLSTLRQAQQLRVTFTPSIRHLRASLCAVPALQPRPRRLAVWGLAAAHRAAGTFSGGALGVSLAAVVGSACGAEVWLGEASTMLGRWMPRAGTGGGFAERSGLSGSEAGGIGAIGGAELRGATPARSMEGRGMRVWNVYTRFLHVGRVEDAVLMRPVEALVVASEAEPARERVRDAMRESAENAVKNTIMRKRKYQEEQNTHREEDAITRKRKHQEDQNTNRGEGVYVTGDAAAFDTAAAEDKGSEQLAPTTQIKTKDADADAGAGVSVIEATEAWIEDTDATPKAKPMQPERPDSIDRQVAGSEAGTPRAAKTQTKDTDAPPEDRTEQPQPTITDQQDTDEAAASSEFDAAGDEDVRIQPAGDLTPPPPESNHADPPQPTAPAEDTVPANADVEIDVSADVETTTDHALHQETNEPRKPPDAEMEPEVEAEREIPDSESDGSEDEEDEVGDDSKGGVGSEISDGTVESSTEQKDVPMFDRDRVIPDSQGESEEDDL